LSLHSEFDDFDEDNIGEDNEPITSANEDEDVVNQFITMGFTHSQIESAMEELRQTGTVVTTESLSTKLLAENEMGI